MAKKSTNPVQNPPKSAPKTPQRPPVQPKPNEATSVPPGASTGASQSESTGSRPQPTYEQIAQRAYEISQSPECGSEMDNWLRAERELRG
jgi:hypothetical protein